MYGRAFFGAQYYGPSYWGAGAGSGRRAQIYGGRVQARTLEQERRADEQDLADIVALVLQALA